MCGDMPYPLLLHLEHKSSQRKEYVMFSSLAGVFGVRNAIGLGSVPALFWAIHFVLLFAGGIYFISRPTTATIDGQAVG
jgi:hypothetical protein